MSDRIDVAGWWNRIPATSRGQAALSFWDVCWSGATAYADGFGSGSQTAYAAGTAYAAMSDSADAINTAITKAKTLGVPCRATGRFRVDSLVTIDTNCDFSGATFVSSSTSLTPILVGTSSSGVLVRRIKALLPRVINAIKTGTGWTGSNAGISISNLMEAKIEVPYITGFPDGLRLTSSGAMGTSYNHFFIGHLDNNKRNMVLVPAASGWVNQNSFYDGRYSHDSAEGSAVSGTRHVLIQGASGLQPNANRWIGSSLESPLDPSVVQYVIESIAGIYNRFYDCRYEIVGSATPNVYFNEIDATYYSRDNTISEGYNASGIVFTQSTNSIRNRYWSEFENVVHASSSTIPAIRFGNSASDAGPQIEGVDLTVDALVAVTGDWRWRLTANALALKAKADTVARISVSTALGVFSWGSGSGAADTNLYRNGTDQLKTDDVFLSAMGVQCVPVARIATATGATTGTIAANTREVSVSVTTDANDIIILPTPTPGVHVTLVNGATGYELRSTSPTTIGINGGTGAAAESAIPANTVTDCYCASATAWVCRNTDTAGVNTATQVAAP